MDDVKPAQFSPGVPLYRQVQTGIEELIRDNPSSVELALSDAHLSEWFGVSRITVRRAVDELVDAGVLYRIQGIGTFVRQKKFREKLTLNSFLDAWTQNTGKFDVRVAAFEKAPADKQIRRAPEGQARDRACLCSAAALPEESFGCGRRPVYPRGLLPPFDRQDVMTSSLVDFLRNRERIRARRVARWISRRGRADRPRRPAYSESRFGSPVLVRRVTFVTKENKPVLTGVSTYRADHVSYRLTLSA